MSILRCDDAVTRPRVAATLLAVSNVPRVVAMMGSRWFNPDTSAAIDGCSSSPPLRMMHDSDGKPSAAWALTTASTTSERSPGVITATPSVSRSSTCSAVMPATSTSSDFALEQFLVAADDRAVDGPLQVAHRGCDQQRLLGKTYDFGGKAFSASATAAICAGSHRLATTAAVCACWPAISTRHSSTTWATSVGVRSLALTASTTGAPRLAAMRALVSSSLGVVTSV